MRRQRGDTNQSHATQLKPAERRFTWQKITNCRGAAHRGYVEYTIVDGAGIAWQRHLYGEALFSYIGCKKDTIAEIPGHEEHPESILCLAGAADPPAIG